MRTKFLYLLTLIAFTTTFLLMISKLFLRDESSVVEDVAAPSVRDNAGGVSAAVPLRPRKAILRTSNAGKKAPKKKNAPQIKLSEEQKVQFKTASASNELYDEIMAWLDSISIDKRQRDIYLRCFERGWFEPEDVPIEYREPKGDDVGVFMWYIYSFGVDDPPPMPPEIEEENRRLSKMELEAIANEEYELAEEISQKIIAISAPYWKRGRVWRASLRDVPEDWLPYFREKFAEYKQSFELAESLLDK